MKASRYSLRASSPGALWRRSQSALSHRRTPRDPRESLLAGYSRYNLLFVTMCKVVLLILRYIRRFLVCKYKKKKKKAWKHTASTVLTSTLEMTARLSGVHFQVVSWRRSLPMHAIAPIARVNLNITAFCMNMTLRSQHRLHIRSLDLSLLPKVVNYTPQLAARGKRSWAYALHGIPVRVKEFYFSKLRRQSPLHQVLTRLIQQISHGWFTRSNLTAKIK